MTTGASDIARRQAELAELREKIARLMEGADRVPTDLRHEYREQLAGLEELFVHAEEELSTAVETGEPLAQRKAGGGRPYEDLELAVERALARFGAPD